MAYFNPYTQLIDQADMSPLGGAAAGFLQGGPVGAAIGGISGMLNSRRAFRQADEAVRTVDENPDLVGVDIYGKPTFNSAGAVEATQSMNELSSASRKRRRGLRGLFGSHDSHKLAGDMQIKAHNIAQGLQSQRDMFNSQTMDYNNQQAAMAQYNQLLNNQNRMNNLYNIGTSLY